MEPFAFHPELGFESVFLIFLCLFLATFMGTEIIFQVVKYIKEDVEKDVDAYKKKITTWENVRKAEEIIKEYKKRN